MNKLFFVLLAVCVGVAGYGLLHHRVQASGTVVVAAAGQWHNATNELAISQEAFSALQDEIQAKRERLRQAGRHANITPEMLELLENKDLRGHDRAWAQLRAQLGIGWDTSPDYVLVTKQAIRELWYDKLIYDGHLRQKGLASPDSVELLNLSPDEQAAIKAAFAAALDGQWLRVTKAPPGGDIVAQYTIAAPDAAFVSARSNAFSANITAAIGAERAGLFLRDAWREFAASAAPEPETMIIRQTNVDGQPDLICEEHRGANVSTSLVRYAHYPAFPVLKLFTRGWEGLAQEAGFELPLSFNPNAQP
jgi:hypothetical protein